MKHPNSLRQLLKLAGKFQKALATNEGYCVFAAGIENAFALADQPPELTQEDYIEWLSAGGTRLSASVRKSRHRERPDRRIVNTQIAAS